MTHRRFLILIIFIFAYSYTAIAQNKNQLLPETENNSFIKHNVTGAFTSEPKGYAIQNSKELELLRKSNPFIEIPDIDFDKYNLIGYVGKTDSLLQFIHNLSYTRDGFKLEFTIDVQNISLNPKYSPSMFWCLIPAIRNFEDVHFFENEVDLKIEKEALNDLIQKGIKKIEYKHPIPLQNIGISSFSGGGYHIIRNEKEYDKIQNKSGLFNYSYPYIDFEKNSLIGYILPEDRFDSIQSIQCGHIANGFLVTVNVRIINLPNDLLHVSSKWYLIPAVKQDYNIYVIENIKKQRIHPRIDDRIIQGSMDILLNVIDTLPATYYWRGYKIKGTE